MRFINLCCTFIILISKCIISNEIRITTLHKNVCNKLLHVHEEILANSCILSICIKEYLHKVKLDN